MPITDETGLKGGKEKAPKSSGDIEALLDLQDFLDKQVPATKQPKSLRRAFTPLTDGLGLESPKKAGTLPPPLPPWSKEEFLSAPPSSIQRLFDGPEAPPKLFDGRPESIAEAPHAKVAEPLSQAEPGLLRDAETPTAPTEAEAPEAEIPAFLQEEAEIPRPSAMRRLLASLLDEVFVLTFFCIALVLTSNALSGFSSGFSSRVFQEVAKPVFLRFAALEFAALWLAYFAVCLGALDRTFGMWVWGIHVFFGEKSDESTGLRKLLRIVWSFLFYAPIVPLILLPFSRKGRNLLDAFSGTRAFRSA